MKRVVAIFVLGFLFVSTSGQLNLEAILGDPKLEPLVNIVLTDAQTCIADPAIISGDFSLEGDLCPGLLQLLDDVYNNVEDPVITCEQSCINLFDKVTEQCYNALRQAIEGADEKYSVPGQKFFATCDQTSGGSVPSDSSPAVNEASSEEGSSSASSVLTPIALILVINLVLMASLI